LVVVAHVSWVLSSHGIHSRATWISHICQGFERISVPAGVPYRYCTYAIPAAGAPLRASILSGMRTGCTRVRMNLWKCLPINMHWLSYHHYQHLQVLGRRVSMSQCNRHFVHCRMRMMPPVTLLISFTVAALALQAGAMPLIKTTCLWASHQGFLGVTFICTVVFNYQHN
jgi:hypothetical protein